MATWIETLEENRGRIFLSYGGGVNSKAMYIRMIELGFVPDKDFYAVYANHGGDCPETMHDIEEMNRNGFPVTVWDVCVEGHESIFDYFWAKQSVPSITNSCKDCTFKFKIDPIHQAVEWIMKAIAGADTYVQVIGIDAGESHRGHQTEHKGIPNIYPLKEEGVDRGGCKEIIRRNGHVVPPKSACFFCPNRKLNEWKDLRREHPDLFFAAVALEERNNERRVSVGRTPVYLHNKMPLTTAVNEFQSVLSDAFERTPHTETYLPLPASDQEYLCRLVEQEMRKNSGIDYYVYCENAVAEIVPMVAEEYGVAWEEYVELFDQPISFVVDRKQGRTVRAVIRRKIKEWRGQQVARAQTERLAALEEDGTLQWMLENGYANGPKIELRFAA